MSDQLPARWMGIADGIFVRRHIELDLSLGLIVGTQRCLVVDTGTNPVHGAEFATAAREITALPQEVVITHGHFDHCFGTAGFLPARVWAHPGCAAHLERTSTAQRAQWARHYQEQELPELATRIATTEPITPTAEILDTVELDLGDRTVRLAHLGRGHTDHDVVALVPDARVVFAGDLIEQGAPPSFEDSYSVEWTATVDALLECAWDTAIPGHGEPVDRRFVRRQRDEIAEVARVRRRYTSA